MKMKRLILALALAAVAISGCAHLTQGASGGASAVEAQSPFPKSSSNIAGN
jgi:curli biogenesis system outer membrane secretion channel CsgG